VYEKLNFQELGNLLDHFDKSKVRAIYLLLPYDSSIDINFLLLRYQRISKLLFFNYIGDSSINSSDFEGRVRFTKSRIEDNSCCGKVGLSMFSSNITLYAEGLKHNTCLNQKLSISNNGEVKNCPSMTSSFGNILNEKLEDIIAKPGFKKLWNINKEKIKKCKFCEFRYVCTDCRAYLEDPEDLLSSTFVFHYSVSDIQPN